MELQFAAVTDTGPVRLHNEDTFIAERDLGLFAVVDGMGGHAGGEIASRTVAAGVVDFIRATAIDPEKTWPFGIDPELSQPANRLQVAIRTANRRLADLVRTDQTLGGTGATISAALFDHDRLVVSNVGDCRAYLFRQGKIEQITRDHSFVAEQVALGLIDTTEAKSHPLRHLVTRAVSGDSTMTVDTWEIAVQPGDRVLLCSDGVHGVMDDNDLAQIVVGSTPLQTICTELVEASRVRGGTDNSTVVLVVVSG